MIVEEVKKNKERSGFSVRKTLRILGISASTYYGFKGKEPPVKSKGKGFNSYEVLPEEKEAVIDYALAHPELRHRELAYRMIDENVAYLSSSTVYRILSEESLIRRWDKKAKEKRVYKEGKYKPDDRWQSDIKMVRIEGRDYPLITFLDCASRAIPHHELMLFMDGHIRSGS